MRHATPLTCIANTDQGHFRSTQPDASKIFCATKVCYFATAEVTRESIQANITERLTNISGTRLNPLLLSTSLITSAQSVELLQFHWQNVSNRDGFELVVYNAHSNSMQMSSM
jgi:hypothetical protein